MKKRLIYLTLLLFLIVIFRIVDIKFINNKEYTNAYLLKSNNNITGYTASRGRILDTNGKVLVDNVSINNVIYRKLSNINSSEELDIASKIIKLLGLKDEASDDELKRYYLANNNTEYLLTSDELNKEKYRILSDDDINKLKLERINDEINKYSVDDRILIHTYYLMQKGYKTDTKIIKEDVDDNVCASILENNIQGISCSLAWKRVNNYDVLGSIMGNVGNIPEEDKENYLNAGYDINDVVGLSGLEKYYDNDLKGTKAQYQVNSDNTLTLIKDEVKGNDLILSINIDIELKAEELLKEHLELAIHMQNTDYYNHAYIIVSSPKNGNLLAVAGLRRNDDGTYQDISSDAMNSAYTVGSVVKGASHTVGYLNGLIDVGKKITDSCVKLYNVPEKCSYKRLGVIDDITALKTSSNYYQFITAIKSTGNTYKNNIKIDVTEDNFNKYRDVFKLYGLGSLTGIDFPKESIGLTGNKVAADLLLNLAIGQYDTYTPMQLMAYINTIANNGNRYALSLKKQDNNIIDNVNLDQYYMDRIQEGFYQVVNYGTGRGYTNTIYNALGKTGTSECYYGNGITTITQSYIMYAPRDDPKYLMVIVNPNLSYNNNDNNYIAPINRLISRKMSDYLLAIN